MESWSFSVCLVGDHMACMPAHVIRSPLRQLVLTWNCCHGVQVEDDLSNVRARGGVQLEISPGVSVMAPAPLL